MFKLARLEINVRRLALAIGAISTAALGASAPAHAAPLPLFPFFMSPPVQLPPVQAEPAPYYQAPQQREDERPAIEQPARFKRQIVTYPTREAAGTIIIDTPNTYLYYVLGGGQAIRYGIGVGRDGFT